MGQWYPPTVPESLPLPLVSELRRIVGAEHVLTDPDRLLVYESDASATHRALPGAVVLPGSTEEVAAGRTSCRFYRRW